MINIIPVYVGRDHIYECATKTIAREGESLATQLQITLADELTSCWAYIDFKKPSGETVKTPRLEIVDGVVTYDIPQYVLDEEGELSVQLVLQNADGLVWKSTTKKYLNKSSIDATDDIPEKEDFITEAQKLLDELSDIEIGGGGEGGDIDLSGYAKKEDLDQKADKTYVDEQLEKISSSKITDYQCQMTHL